MGSVFENICLDYMYLPKSIASAPFFYGNIGRWWGNNPPKRRQEEIDLLSIEESAILLGECKWTKEDIGLPVLTALIEKGNLFPQPEKWYYLFSKNDFTKAVKDKASKDPHIQLISFAEMVI